MVLGDSLTFGQGIAEEDRYSNVLETLLKNRYPGVKIEVINLGVQGFETLQEFRMLPLMWQAVEPDLTVLGFFANDPNLHYEHYRPHTFYQTDAQRKFWNNFLLIRLVEIIYDPVYRTWRDIPTHQQEIDGAYRPDSRDWQIFSKCVEGIAAFVRGKTGQNPIVIFLSETDRAKKEGKYKPVRDIFEKEGYVWVEFGGKKIVPVSRFEYHPGAETNRDYARVLFEMIEQRGFIPQWQKLRKTGKTSTANGR